MHLLGCAHDGERALGGLMEKAILLALAASFCTATASVCQRLGAKSHEASGFDVWLIFRPARRLPGA
jgi:hypothetical protein